MTPPLVQPEAPSPYRLEIGASYHQLDLAPLGPVFSGPSLDFRLGQDFDFTPNHRLFLNGVFRYASLTGRTDSINPPVALSDMYLGMEGGYEFSPAPGAFSAFVSLGMGVNTFFSEGIRIGPGDYRTLENGGSFAFDLGAGITLGGLLVLRGGWQPNLGLQMPIEGDAPLGANPQAFYFGGSIDLVRAMDLAGSIRLPQPDSLEEYLSGVQTPRVMIHGIYTGGYDHHFGNGEARATIYRPSDANNPLGFGINVAVGAGDGREIGSPAEETRRGFYVEMEEAFLNLRFPVAEGMVIQGGRFFILGQPLGTPNTLNFTFTGLEDHEAPVNNHLSHSYQFHYALPLSFGAFRIQTRLAERWMLSLATLHDWGNFFGRDGGGAAYANLAWNPAEEFTTSLTGIAGRTGEDPYTNLSWQGVLCLPAVSGCTINNATSRFNAALNYTYGNQAGHSWHSLAAYLRLNFIKELGIAGRAEVFADPEGVRTGIPEDLLSLTATLHVNPLPWLQLRGEVRHDWSTAENSRGGPLPEGSGNSFGVGTAIVF